MEDGGVKQEKPTTDGVPTTTIRLEISPLGVSWWRLVGAWLVAITIVVTTLQLAILGAVPVSVRVSGAEPLCLQPEPDVGGISSEAALAPLDAPTRARTAEMRDGVDDRNHGTTPEQRLWARVRGGEVVEGQ